MNTDELIEQLSDDAAPQKPLATPTSLWAISLIASLLYMSALLMLLGIRPDMHAYIMQPYSFIEIWLLLMLLASSLWSAVCHVYPDHCGKSLCSPLPYIAFLLLLVVIAVQIDWALFLPAFKNTPMHMTCLSCIAAASVLPSILLFLLTQKGASVRPFTSGIMITFSALSIGCLAMRLHEPSMDMLHVLIFHYAPIFVLAAIGAVIGKMLLKW